MNSFVINAWLLMILSSILMSPRLGEGLLSLIRIDDVLLPLSTILLFIYFPIFYKKIGGIIIPLLRLYLFTAFVAIITHYSGFDDVQLFGKLGPFIKQIQFLTYFCLFFCLFSSQVHTSNVFKKRMYLFFLCFIPNIIYGLFQIITFNYKGYYGIGSINEVGATLTGSIFYFAMIISIIMSQFENDTKIRYLYLSIAILNLLFVILSGSRGAFAASIAFIFVNNIYDIFILKKHYKKAKYLFIIFTFLLGIVLLGNLLYLSSSLFEYIDLLPNRLGTLTLSKVVSGGRLATWPAILSKYISIIKLHPLILLVGLGSGGFYEIIGELANGADSQLMYTIIAGGVIGFFLYIESLFKFYCFTIKKINDQLKSIFISMFFSFMIFSFTQEVFILSKTGALFWSICGMLLGYSFSGSNKNTSLTKKYT